MSFFFSCVVVSVLIVIIVIVSTFVVLHKAKTRKCKFDKLYENVSTSHIQANGQYHKQMKNKKLRLICHNEIYHNLMALSVYTSDFMLLLVHISVL